MENGYTLGYTLFLGVAMFFVLLIYDGNVHIIEVFFSL